MIKYTYIFFVFVHSDVIKLNTAERNKSRRSFIPLYHSEVTILVNQSMFCSDFSSTLLVPFAVLGTPIEVHQKKW